jgi:hypothetical protein
LLGFLTFIAIISSLGLTLFSFRNLLQGINLPDLLHDVSSGIEDDAMNSIEHYILFHEYASERLPIDEGLLDDGDLKRSDDYFEYGYLALIDGHELSSVFVEVGERGIQVTFMEKLQVRKTQ